MDMAVGIPAAILVLEATRRTIGAALPIVAMSSSPMRSPARGCPAGSTTGA